MEINISWTVDMMYIYAGALPHLPPVLFLIFMKGANTYEVDCKSNLA